jgi:ribosomal protein S12 methylthiotransferase
MRSLCLINLGCPKNLVDGEVMLGRLAAAGFRPVADPAEAEVIVVNTCGFIEAAREEAVDVILDAAGYKERGSCRTLVAAGCLVQDQREALADAIPELDALVGLHEIHRIVDLCGGPAGEEDTGDDAGATVPQRILGTPPHLAYLKIAEGCDNHCTFCTVPRIRGPLLSRPQGELLAEAAGLVGRGVRELILVAQDTTAYGHDLDDLASGGTARLVSLLEGLSAIPGLLRMRLMYAYPERLDDRLVRALAELSAVCPYLDIPLQHVSARVLRRMGRGAGAPGGVAGPGAYQDLVDRLRADIPGLAIRTSLIAGFPGESEAEFVELERFLVRNRLDHVGVFAFSPEPGTPAARLGDLLPPQEAEARRNRLMEVQQSISLELNQEKVGRRVTVLVDGPAVETDLLLEGRMATQAFEVDGVVLINEGQCRSGELVDVELTEAHPYDLVGRVVGRESEGDEI